MVDTGSCGNYIATVRSSQSLLKKETDLYAPLREYLEKQGYGVRSEVRGVDVVAERDGEVLVFEMKRSLSLSLLAQAVERRRSFGSVYLVVPHPGRRVRSGEWKATCRLIRTLELGLILIRLKEDRDSQAVEVVFHPGQYRPRERKDVRRAVLSEAHARSADLNVGGSVGCKIMTAYRERAVHIACCLNLCGPLSPAMLRKMGTCDHTGSILYRNYYGWFCGVRRGLYALTDKGRGDILGYPELYERYMNSARTAVAEATPDSRDKD